ncbi:MAG: sulfatase [Chthoniobacteraceae bacterium]
MRPPEDRPNIILINCDDLGYGDVGCYGSKVNKTPAIDRLAAEGMRFTDFYMVSPVCSPSRGGMMTGCLPPRIGFGEFNGAWVLFPGHAEGLNPSEITVAKLLKQRGYATGLVGKWHCGDQPDFLPTRHGFDTYFGLPYSNDMGRQSCRGENQLPPLPLLRGEEIVQEQPDQAGITERYAQECVDFIRANKAGPFFLYLAHMHVHLPLIVAKRFLDQAQNGPYGAAVEAIDWVTGVILHELEKLGLDRHTLIVFTSDNGSRGDNGGSNFPLRGGKGSTWEGGMRLPFIARWPGKIPAGTISSEVTASIDFLPTFAALAGGSAPTDRVIDGRDIRDLLFDVKGAHSPHEAFPYYKRNQLEAMRMGKWKLHLRKDENVIHELYDLEADIAETHNLHDQCPEIVAAFQPHIERYRDDIGDSAVSREGKNCRAVGRVENPVPLTTYDPQHPYIIAMYDGQAG